MAEPVCRHCYGNVGAGLGASVGTCGVGGHQGRDDGVGLNGEGMHSYGDSGVVGLGRGCLAVGTSWGHHRGHMGWVNTREGMLEWNAFLWEPWGCGARKGVPGVGGSLGASQGTHGMGGHQGRDDGVGGNKEGMHSYGNLGAGQGLPGVGDISGDTWDGGTIGKGCWSGMHSHGNPGAVGLGRGSPVLGAAWGHVGCGDTREGTLEWGSARKECIPMGTLRLWGWAGGAWRWGHPGGDTEGSEVVVGGGG